MDGNQHVTKSTHSYADCNLIEIFYIRDKFCKYFAPELKKHTLGAPDKRHCNRPSRMIVR